jgi:hypothetical protein
MKYKIRMGRPQMADYWYSMIKKQAEGTLGKNERALFTKVQKAVGFLREDPAYPGLNSHDIDALTKREGFTVYESYLENHTPIAGRMFWAYGPDKGDITILGIVPHPSKSGYKRVPLSHKPETMPTTETKGKKKNAKKNMVPSRRKK